MARHLRGLSSILVRWLAGTVAGALVAILVYGACGLKFVDALVIGAFLGGIIGMIHGVVVWVFFPYKSPNDSPREPASRE